MHSVLKRETAHLHRQLNTLPNTRVLMTAKLGLSDYSRILMAFAQGYKHIEQQLIPLEKSVKLGALRGYRPRLPSLIEDIASLDGAPPPQLHETGASSVPVDARLPAHYFGLRYVVDGSTQGGRFIEQRLRKNLPELTARAFAFWNVQIEVSEQWPVLCASIDRLGQSVECQRQMVEAANGAFRTFIEAFSFPE